MIGFRNLYLGSLFGFVIADRILGTDHSLYIALLSVSVLGNLGSAFVAKRQSQTLLPSLLIILVPIGYICWWVGDVQGQQWLSISEDNLYQWQAFFQSLGGILWTISLIPILAIHNILQLGSKHVSQSRINHQGLLWLGTSCLFLSMFPINYVAHDTNQRWDFGYFKTSTPGESSLNLVENLDQPITLYLFFQMGMDVTEEIRTYFDQLSSPNLEIRYVDKDLEPSLATELSVQNNGIIILSKGDADNRSTERIQIGKTLSAAKRKLKKLDEEFRKSLLKLTQTSNTLYFTSGHGELYWKVNDDEDSSRKISFLKRGLTSSNFAIKELNIANGLANEIPEDAAAVFVLAPQSEFSEVEVNTLLNYWMQGKSLFITLEPDGAKLESLLNALNLKYDNTPLVHGSIYMPTASRALPIHKRNLITNKFSTHPSVTTLSRYNKVMQLVFEQSGSLQKSDGDAKVTTLIKSLENTWKDSNSNLTKESIEAEDLWPIAMAVESSLENDKQAKAVVFADSTWITDTYLVKSLKIGQQAIQPHAITLSDTVFWLTDKKDASGTINNEQDVKIQHSKEGQGWVFFGTSIGFPILIFGIGRWRIRRRNRGGQ